MFQKSSFAKFYAWLGAALTGVGVSGLFGPKWSPVAALAGAAITGASAHTASNTSAGHPEGANTP